MAACREYRGHRDHHGYGIVRFGPSKVTARGHVEKRSPVRLNRWVIEQVEGRRLGPDEVVRHTCDNPPCFLYEHLVVGTQADNVRDRDERGRQRSVSGDDHPNAKLTAEIVSEIRRAVAHGETYTALVVRFDVSRQTISRAARGLSWADDVIARRQEAGQP